MCIWHISRTHARTHTHTHTHAHMYALTHVYKYVCTYHVIMHVHAFNIQMLNFFPTFYDEIEKLDLRELYVAQCPKPLLPPQTPLYDYSKEIILTPSGKV